MAQFDSRIIAKGLGAAAVLGSLSTATFPARPPSDQRPGGQESVEAELLVDSLAIPPGEVAELRGELLSHRRGPEIGGAKDGADYTKRLEPTIRHCFEEIGVQELGSYRNVAPLAKNVTEIYGKGDPGNPIRLLVSGELQYPNYPAADSVGGWFGLFLPAKGPGFCKLVQHTTSGNLYIVNRDFFRHHRADIEGGERPHGFFYGGSLFDGCIPRMPASEWRALLARANGKQPQGEK